MFFSDQLNLSQFRQHWVVRYGAAFAATAIALGIWFMWPVMHQDPFAIFITAVIVSARFFGFGPALLSTISSALALDYFVFASFHLSFGLSTKDSERLLVFVLVSLLTAGLARQRTQAETRAIETRQRMAAIVESSEDAILSTSLDSIITSWNRGAEVLYSYTAAEAVGQHISLTAPPERVHEISLSIARLQRGEHVGSYQTEHVRKDGSPVSVLLSVSPMRNRRGAMVGCSVIARDVTTQRRAEEALRRNEKLATAGRLVATIAHEINNPLEAVTNLLYLARHDPAKKDEYLARAENEVQRVGSIAQQTLGFVREGISATPLNVAETLDQVLQLYLPKLNAKRIQIERKYDARADISGFPGELRQLFSNLIINAIDAMGEGGRLFLRVARSREWTSNRRSGVRVTIADSGAGIRPADLSHIFEPFYTTKTDAGTGLGLWLSYGIVQKHGGSIRVRSRTVPQHSGTTFSLFLPDEIERPKAA
jgi:two-component system, chemotaxis family, CheB/CheR fusion protein